VACAIYSIKYFIFITEMKIVYCAVRTGFSNTAVCNFLYRNQSVLIFNCWFGCVTEVLTDITQIYALNEHSVLKFEFCPLIINTLWNVLLLYK
jgi:hypothetical protein